MIMLFPNNRTPQPYPHLVDSLPTGQTTTNRTGVSRGNVCGVDDNKSRSVALLLLRWEIVFDVVTTSGSQLDVLALRGVKKPLLARRGG